MEGDGPQVSDAVPARAGAAWWLGIFGTQVPWLPVVGVLAGGFAYFMFEEILGGRLHEYPLTRSYGPTVPVLTLVLICIPATRRRLGALLVGPPVVYALGAAWFAGLFLAAGPFGLILSVPGGFYVVVFGGSAYTAWSAGGSMLRRTAVAALSIMLMLSVPAVDAARRYFGFPGKLSRAIESAAVDGSVRVEDHTDFEWDRMHVFGWYMSAREIDADLGIAWDDSRKDRVRMSEGHHLFVFVESGRVVEAYEISRGTVDFCPKLATLVRWRKEALFSVGRRSDGMLCLQHGAQKERP